MNNYLTTKEDETRKASLSWGMFDEEHTYKPTEQYSQTLFDCKTQKIKGFAKEKPLYNEYNFDPVVFAWNVDPLTAKYPQQTPYTFASNSPIAGIDKDGLEFYFAADGTFLGKYGKSGEIRIANVGAEQIITKMLNTYKNHPQVGISQEELAKINTTKMLFTHDITTASLNEASNVYTTIYKREINGDANSVSAVNLPSDYGGEHMKGNININKNQKRNGEYINSDYYNVSSNLYHENKHFEGFASNLNPYYHFEHFDIQNSLLSKKYYKKSTNEFKNFVKSTMYEYIGMQETYIANQITFYKNSGNIDENIIKDMINKYEKNVNTYNQEFGESRETIKFLIK